MRMQMVVGLDTHRLLQYLRVAPEDRGLAFEFAHNRLGSVVQKARFRREAFLYR